MIVGVVLVVALGAAALVLFSSGHTGPPKQTSKLLGHGFPSVSSSDLTGRVRHVPADFAGAPVIVLVTPSKGSQPDADRWIAFLRGRSDLRFCEVPVIPTLMAHMMQGFINGQMRGGLPHDMWSRVIPVYAQAGKLKSFFGAYGDKVAWVVVLDGAGVVRWFRAAGFSSHSAAEAAQACLALQ